MHQYSFAAHASAPNPKGLSYSAPHVPGWILGGEANGGNENGVEVGKGLRWRMNEREEEREKQDAGTSPYFTLHNITYSFITNCQTAKRLPEPGN